jgi:hypothetical protein
MCFLVNYALRLFSVVERRLKSGFNKIEEGGHELVEMVSAAVLLSVCSSATPSGQHYPPCPLSS